MRGLHGASALAALVTAAMLFASTPDAAEDDFPILFGGPFKLIDHTGAVRTDESYGGRFLIVMFGYTNCNDVCPLGLQTIARTLDLLGEDAQSVQPLFITTDPKRDTPAVLADYVSRFHLRIAGLTGSEAQIAAVARAYKVFRRKIVLEGATGDKDYLVDHSSIAYLMGPEGEFLSLFPYNTAPEFMAEAIERHLSRHAL